MICCGDENDQRPRSASAMARSRGAPAGREGDRDHPRRQAGGQARADRRAPEAAQAVRSRRPREGAAQNRGGQGFALGRSRRKAGARGSALRCGGGGLPPPQLPAGGPAGGTGEGGGGGGGGGGGRGGWRGAARRGG